MDMSSVKTYLTPQMQLLKGWASRSTLPRDLATMHVEIDELKDEYSTMHTKMEELRVELTRVRRTCIDETDTGLLGYHPDILKPSQFRSYGVMKDVDEPT